MNCVDLIQHPLSGIRFHTGGNIGGTISYTTLLDGTVHPWLDTGRARRYGTPVSGHRNQQSTESAVSVRKCVRANCQ